MSGNAYRKQQSLARGVAKSAVLVATGVGLNWAGNASARAVDFFEYPWGEELSFSRLFSDMLELPRVDLISTIQNGFLFPYLNSLMLIGALAAVVATLAYSRGTLWFLNFAAIISLPYGILGLFAVPIKLDVEYFSEGWSLLFAHTLWTIVLGLYAVRMNGHMARTPTFDNMVSRVQQDTLQPS